MNQIKRYHEHISRRLNILGIIWKSQHIQTIIPDIKRKYFPVTASITISAILSYAQKH